MTRLEELKAKMTQNNNVNANTSSGNTPTRLAQLKAKTLQNTNATNTAITKPTFKTAEEALNYAKQNNIKVAGNTNVSPKVTMPNTENNVLNNINTQPTTYTKDYKNWLEQITPQKTNAGDVLAKDEIKWDDNNKRGIDIAKGSLASLGANALDATVDTGQFVKNSFKSEMKKEEREAIEGLIKLENGFRGSFNQLSEEQAKTMADNIRKKYGLEGLTVQDLQNKLNGIIDWTYKENALEKATSNLVDKVNQNNAELGKVGQYITNAFGTVGRMGPTIASNLVVPGSGMPVMFANVAQSQTENLMEQGVDYKNAVTNGLLSGALEVGTEMLSGGISQRLTGIPAISKVGEYTKNISSPFLKGAIDVGLDITSEGLEEVASTIVQPFIDRITYDKNAPLATGEDLLASFTESILPTLLMQGGSFAMQKLNQYTETQKNEIEKADISSSAKKQMIEALEIQKDKIAKQIEELSKSNTNLQENTQNHSNIEQSSQNNVQNVSNLENNQQMSISDVENTNATLPSHIQTFVENRNKVSPGLSVQIDNTLNTDGVIIKNQDGTRTIKINPSSNNAYEFVALHEMLHDLEGAPKEYQELANFVIERAVAHDTFEEAKQTITDKYTKYYQENGLDMSNLNMDVETVNDMTAQALGNQEFLNELAGKKPNVFMRIYNWVKNVLFDGQKTGKTFSERRADNKYLNKLKKKFETAYNTAYKGNVETKYSIQTDNNGNKYVKVDTNQNIFDGKTLKEQKKIAKEYILKNFREKGLIKDNQNINVTRKTANEYTYPKNILNKGIALDKMKASTELNNLLNISQYKYSKPDDGRHSFAKNGWEYYETIFQVGNKTYSGLLNIANDGNKKMLYDITNIKEMNSNISMETESSANSSLSNYSIPSTDSSVNNQYMQNNENDVQEYYSISGNGYSGHSMSNNAIKAYEEGKKPISKFVKEDVNKFNQLLQERGINEKITLKELKALLEKYSGSEWHHTSSRYNKTNFYDINDVLENDNSDIENTIKEIRDSKEKSANIKEILKTKSGETEQEYYTRIGNYVLDKRIENCNKDGLNFLAVKEEESRKDPSYVYDAGRTFGVWDYGAKYTPQELENSGSFSLPKNNSKIDEIADILNIYEQYKYEDKTSITESIDELEQKISETTDWDTRYDLNAKLKALKNGYNSVYDYLIGREKQRIAENLNYNEHYYDKQLNEKTQKNERQKKLDKEIKEATPFKRAQYEIIQETNPMFDDEHVGIRSPTDIKTFEEVIDDEESFQWGDYTKEDALKDLKRNKVRVYSSYPIKNGVFVSTSYEQALEYAGNDRNKVHSKEVAPNRVAWINGDEGQYASVTNERLNKAKSLDNTTPTTNSDIRYSQSDKSWSKYLKEYWDLMPNSTKTFGLPSAEELQRFDNEQGEKAYKSLHKLEDIADMTEEDIRNEKGVNYKHKKDKDTQYERKFFENAKTSEIINDDIKESIDVTTYERQSNAETLEKAKNKLDEQGDKLIKQWETKTKNFTAEDVAIGAILIERYQQQGDNESAVNVVQKLADMGTEVGRAVQMYSIFQRLTPEAMMIYQQRKLNDVFKEISQKKTGEWVEENKEKFKLTKEDSQFITEQVEKAQQATSEREKQIELAKIEKRINDKLPPERGQTIKAIRRMAMLFNPKTQVRNVVGNALIMPVNDVADIIGTQIDKLIAKKTGVRTTNYADFKEKGKGIKKGLGEAVQDYKMGVRTEPSGSKYEFNFGGKSFNENTKSKTLNFVNNKLNGIENLLGAVMSGGDRPFYEAAFNNSLQGQMKANNVTTPTTEMIDIAVNEALSRTWNDNNSYTEAVLAVRRAMNKLNIGGFGFGDLIIPFAKTPANLTKAIVEYSPVGLVEAIIDYSDMKKAISRGEMTATQQKKFVNSMSKAIAGSILYLIAGTLAHTGAITGSADDDKDVRNFEQNVLGIQPYSIKIGDKTFTYSWANPLNAPLAIIADTYKMSKNNEKLFDILYNALKTAGEVVADNSFLQGIKKLFEADSLSEGLVDAFLNMPSQFIPTFLSQFATLFDKNKRQTFEYGDKLKTTVNQMKTKIPGLKNTLAPTVNTFGEEVENYGGDNNIFNVFLNPANISKANATDTQKELYSLYEATEDNTIFPRQAPYYLSDDGEKINLSSKERTEYQKTSGQYVTENLGALLDSEFYKSLDNEDKVELINEVISDADTVAKDKWIDTKTTEKVSSRNKELDEAGIPLIDYYNAWFAKKEAEGKKNYKGETISSTEKKAQKTAINEAVSDDLTVSQRKQLYKILGVD